jgi:hypothetical protein
LIWDVVTTEEGETRKTYYGCVRPSGRPRRIDVVVSFDEGAGALGKITASGAVIAYV